MIRLLSLALAALLVWGGVAFAQGCEDEPPPPPPKKEKPTT